ncbi:MAG: hypothetical protein DRI93_02705 [Aquificota bacterium]|nr:MAG: hypothetical protein DRI93_02705 [Aquificota bacterium]
MPSSVVCVDASFILRLLIGGPGEEKAAEVWKEWEGTQIIAPGLIFYEIGNALHRLVLHGTLSPKGAEEFMNTALNLGIKTYHEDWLFPTAMQLARKLKLPALYYAYYLALAQATNTELWTADLKLYKKARKAVPLIKTL